MSEAAETSQVRTWNCTGSGCGDGSESYQACQRYGGLERWCAAVSWVSGAVKALLSRGGELVTFQLRPRCATATRSKGGRVLATGRCLLRIERSAMQRIEEKADWMKVWSGLVELGREQRGRQPKLGLGPGGKVGWGGGWLEGGVLLLVLSCSSSGARARARACQLPQPLFRSCSWLQAGELCVAETQSVGVEWSVSP